MVLRISVSLVAFVSMLTSACAPASGPGSVIPAGGPSGTGSADQDRTLAIAVSLEPSTLAGRGLELVAGNARQNLPPLLFNAGLTQQDETVTPHPYLAEALPQFGTDTWKVFPDGRMETTWRLRPNLTWHDGAPLVAEDFAFSIQARIALKTEGSNAGGTALAGLIDEARAPDARTLVIQWKTSFPPAGQSDWQPLPRHILGADFEEMTPEAFGILPYWTTEFVGVGPYQLTRWERGAFIEGTAFPGYVHGQPRIKQIKLLWISDPNTAVANILSGTVHLAANGAIVSAQATVLRREWAARGEAGSVLVSPDTSRYMATQYKIEYTNPKALLDVRVRQAFAHAIDKQALVDYMLDGEPGIAETALSPGAAYYSELDRVLTKYPLDLRRSEQLMSDAGFTKDAGGFYGQNGIRLTPEILAIGDGRGDRESTIVADSLKRAGIEAPTKILSPVEARSIERISSFPAFSISGVATGAVLGGDSISNKFQTSGIASAANRWVGTNRTGFSDPEYDRLYQTLHTTLDANERNRAQVQAEKLLSEQAAYFPLYYNYGVLAHVVSFAGPRTAFSTPDSSSVVWKIQDWHWQ